MKLRCRRWHPSASLDGLQSKQAIATGPWVWRTSRRGACKSQCGKVGASFCTVTDTLPVSCRSALHLPPKSAVSRPDRAPHRRANRLAGVWWAARAEGPGSAHYLGRVWRIEARAPHKCVLIVLRSAKKGTPRCRRYFGSLLWAQMGHTTSPKLPRLGEQV